MPLLQVVVLVILQVGGNFLFESALNQYLDTLLENFLLIIIIFLNIINASWAKFPIGNYVLPILILPPGMLGREGQKGFLFLEFKQLCLSVQWNRLLDTKALLLLMMWPSYLMSWFESQGCEPQEVFINKTSFSCF